MAISRHNRPRTIFDLIDFPDPFLIHSSVSKNIPRYNIIKQTAEDTVSYRLEIAIPGWDLDKIDVTMDGDILSVAGVDKLVLAENEQYLHQGLSAKPFKLMFKIGERLELKHVAADKGLLNFSFKLKPEATSEVKKIEILR